MTINLEKFPVVGESGQMYAVTIREQGMGVSAAVYVPTKGLFGRVKFKRVSRGVLEGWYDLCEWENDFVKIARHAVRKVERRSADARNQEEQRLAGIAKFKEWDGDVR